MQAILARKRAMDEAGGIEALMRQKSESGGHSGTRMAFLDLMLE
jgi:NAD(P)H-dependent flavin oxidoreductase YrpB (nitropropane dioxygenase family)